MTAAELKLKIFREIDALDKSKLEEFYGYFINQKQGQVDVNDWLELSEEQRLGIIKGLSEIKEGKGIAHSEVISKIRKKYSNG